MRVLLCTLFLAAAAVGQTPDWAETRRILGEGSRQLQAQHEEAYRELGRVLNARQMAELREMSRWGRYGPPLEVEGAQEFLRALGRPTGLERLMPTPRQEEAFFRALQGDPATIESRLRAIFTPEQYEMLRQLDQSEGW